MTQPSANGIDTTVDSDQAPCVDRLHCRVTPPVAGPEIYLPSILLTIEEGARWLRIGRTKMFELLGDGSVSSVNIGRRRLLHIEELQRYANHLASASQDGA